MTEVADDLLARDLADLVGGTHVVTDPAQLAGRTRDWTGRWIGQCRLAVAPATATEVSDVLARCYAEPATRVVVQGGNTGLVAGALPEGTDVLLLTHRLTHLAAPDLVAHTVVAGAGVTLAALQEHLAPFGLELAVDLASRDTATLGGMAATNAGGIRVLRDGAMRAHVLAVQAYDVTGREIAAAHDLVKDNTGYSLAGLLVGSEGTLAVLTTLVLHVVPQIPVSAVFLVALPDLTSLVAVTGALRRSLSDVRAIEMVSPATLAVVAQQTSTAVPVGGSWALLVQLAGRPTDKSAFERAGSDLHAVLAETGAVDAELLGAADPVSMRSLWSWRERVTESLAAVAVAGGHPVTKLDLTLPAGAFPAFEAGLGALLADRPQQAYLFGHVADGNVHVNLLGPADVEVEDAVLRLAAGLSGSISAEHGIGRAKAPWFALARTAAERDTMRAIKTALDPADRLGRAIWP